LDQYTQELRLLWFLSLNALLLASIARASIAFAGHRRSWLLLDILLFNYVIEYALVCGLGVLGLLTAINLTIGALLIAAVLILLSRKPVPPQPPTQIGKAALFILLFAVFYQLAYLIYRRDLPVLETDALAYHLPVAIEWLRTAHTSILQTWYWNPANTYSPLGAEAFIAWLIAPMGSDLFARWVQAPALLMILLAMVRIGQTLGASPFIAACVAAATVLSRSFFSQATIVKDDLFVAAFFATAIAAVADMAPAKRNGDRLSPLRVGCAIGLLIATKFTALMPLPLLLLVLWPSRRHWSKHELAAAAIIVLALAAPWYLRNAIEFGNPLYPLILNFAGHPILPGLFSTAPDPSLRTPSGIWRIISTGYFATPAPFIAAVALLWLLGLLTPSPDAGSEVFRRAASDPHNSLRYLAGLGAPAGVILYGLTSPLPEARFFLPFFLPFFIGATGGLIALKRWPVLQTVAASAFLFAATCTTFESRNIASIVQFSLEAAAFAGTALALILLWRTHHRSAVALLTVAGLILAGFSYIQFNSFAANITQTADAVWSRPDTYGPLGDAWAFVRHNIPPAATIAYANTGLIDPLYGPPIGPTAPRRLVYAPVRPGIRTFADVPPFGQHIPENEVFQATADAMNRQADLPTWMRNLRQSHAGFLFLAKHGSAENPPEAAFIAALGWKPVFENDAAAVYQLNQLNADVRSR
jgi:hypothetical protein